MTSFAPCTQHLPMQRAGISRICSRSCSLQPTTVGHRAAFATRALEGSAAAGSVIDAEVISASDRRPGVKQRLVSVLEGLERPISAGELWDLCKSNQEVKSKTFMKDMLKQMREDRRVITRPGPRGKSYGYILPANYQALKQKVNEQLLGSADDLPANQLT